MISAKDTKAEKAYHSSNPLPVQQSLVVMTVPGDGGSQVEATLNRPVVDHWWCERKSDWYSLWLNMEILVPTATDCFVDNFKLLYNASTHTTDNPAGVSTRIPGFGNTSTVEYIDPTEQSLTDYYGTMVDYLVKNLGYTRNVDIRGAPYDFRKSPAELVDYMKNVVSLIEETYKMNNNTKVVLIAHSLGTIYTTYLLNQNSQIWKDQYIRAFISLAGPYGGATHAMKMFASGYDFDISLLDALTMREAERTFPSSALLLPSDLYWGKDEVIVYSPSGNFTVNDYSQFFNDINYPEGFQLWGDTQKYIKDLKPPNVEVHCLYGTGIQTAEYYVYTGDDSDWFNSQPTENYMDGDGTVNLRSLLGCKKWVGNQNAAVSLKDFPKTEHASMVSQLNVVTYVAQLLNSLT